MYTQLFTMLHGKRNTCCTLKFVSAYTDTHFFSGKILVLKFSLVFMFYEPIILHFSLHKINFSDSNEYKCKAFIGSFTKN